MQPSAVMLRDFRSLEPPYRGDQARTLDWLASAHAQSEVTATSPADGAEKERLVHQIRRRVLRYGSATQRIRYRNSCLEDFSHTDWDKMRIYSLDTDPAGAGCGERNRVFNEVVGDAFERMYAEDACGPSTLIHVTCTGYASPSGAQRLVSRRVWTEATQILHLYHMGCYASLPAIRIAAGLLATGQRRIDLVHTELCTLHLDPSEHAAEQLVAQALFADGMIRYSAVHQDASEPQPTSGAAGLELRACHEALVPDTEGEMEWLLSDHGMRITLSRAVPDKIKPALPGFIQRLAKEAELSADELCRSALFAVHPGGPKIIDHVGATLGLDDAQLAASNAILESYGNMSSATLPHIWQAMLADPSVPPNTSIVSLAFGPGLTIAGAVLRKRGGD